ncbi:MAG: ribonuclease HII [Bacilli bacterium]
MESISAIRDKFQAGLSGQEVDEYRLDARKGVQSLVARYDKERVKAQAVIDAYEHKLAYERTFWDLGYTHVAGVDEVGRGPLAGPVVVVSVILDRERPVYGVDDSKRLSEAKREALYEEIMQKAVAVSIITVPPNVIDAVNIYQATKEAMHEAVRTLAQRADAVLADAMPLALDVPVESLIKGDQKSASIAAASIVAKVTRDRLMKDYHEQCPGYAFDRNSGYGTPDHLAGLREHGVTPIHRRSFEPVKSLVEKGEM